MLAYSKKYANGTHGATEGKYNFTTTNADLATEGCLETTDVTIDDLVPGSVIKVLMVGNDGVHTTDEWPEIGPFTTISQLKSIVDNHADTMTMTVTASGNYLAAVPSNNNWKFLFNINADDGYLPKGGMQGEYYADPNIWDVAQYAIVFIESQPE